MKKIITVVLAVLMLCGLVGCDPSWVLHRDDPSTTDTHNEQFAKIVADFENSVAALPKYYSMLSDTEKAAYASIVKTINANGTDAPIPYPIDNTSMETVTNAVSYDNPHYMWLSKKWTITSYSTGSASISIPYRCSDAERQAMATELEQKIGQIMGGINSTMGDYEKELYLHDYLVKNCEYDSEALTNEDFANAHTAYGAIVEGKAVCEGYARAMQLLLSRAGVDAYVIAGTTIDSLGITGKHMWNVVKIDSGWYHLDVTWDDPISTTKDRALRHSYFNLTDEEIGRNHFYEIETNCTATKANYHRKNLLFFTSFDAQKLADILADELYKAKRTNQNYVELRFENEGLFNKAWTAFSEQPSLGFSRQ